MQQEQRKAGSEGVPEKTYGLNHSIPQEDEIAALKLELEQKGVQYCLPAYVDIHGIPKSKSVPISHFERAMRGSELFTGAALDGLGQDTHDDELALHPDPRGVTQLPWRPKVAWMPGNLRLHGEPWPMCSRTVLQRQLDRAARLGMRFNLGVECEFFLVRVDGNRVTPANPKMVMHKAAYDVLGLLESMDWLEEVIGCMNQLGWNVHCFDHEDANSQFEIDFEYADALTTADRYVLFRLMAKELARKHGVEVTFMPKPFTDRTGSAAHFNMSLASTKTGENLFADASDSRSMGLSKLAYQFVAGILKHGEAVVATACSTVNSYKRLIKTGSRTGATWAPVYISYGDNNRTHMIRVPKVNPHVENTDTIAKERRHPYLSGKRVECRAVDPTMNPYLAAAMMLGAGLDGIEHDLDPGDPINLNMYNLNDTELAQKQVRTLPRTLDDAIKAFAADDLSRTVMGEDLYQAFVSLKQQEWWDFHTHVSEWEIQRYLTKF
jgi:glutamine synthetase